MKKLFLSFAIATAFVATWVSARAADLPMAPSYQPAPAPVVARVYNWTGFYVGVNGGYGWGSQDPLNIITNRFDSFSTSIAGGAFGGTLGAQIQGRLSADLPLILRRLVGLEAWEGRSTRRPISTGKAP
jgi:outer membrane immunogenic protein